MLITLACKFDLKISDLEDYLQEEHTIYTADIISIIIIKKRLSDKYPNQIKKIVSLIDRLIDAYDLGKSGRNNIPKQNSYKKFS